jgi:hypothetical protein
MMNKLVYGHPEVLSTATYSVGTLLAEEDGWSQIEMRDNAINILRRTLAAGEAAIAIEMISTVLSRPVLDVALVLKTEDEPRVFVREND